MTRETVTPESHPDWYTDPCYIGFPDNDCPTLPGDKAIFKTVYLRDDGRESDEWISVKTYCDGDGNLLTTHQAQARVVLDLETHELIGHCRKLLNSGCYEFHVEYAEQADPRYFPIDDPRRMSKHTMIRNEGGIYPPEIL